MENNCETQMLKTRDGLELFTRLYTNNSEKWIIAVHGVGEHCDRHQYLVELFGKTHNLAFFDLRGHGRSEGPRANIDAFSTFTQDLEDFIEFLVAERGMKEYILFGHSMGALISAKFVQEASKTLYPSKLYLNAPPVGIPGLLGLIFGGLSINTAGLFAKIPKTPALKGLVDLKQLSQDPQVAIDYANDELNSLKLNVHLIMEMLSASFKVFNQPLGAKCPTFCSVGEKDKVVSPKQIQNYFTEIEKGVLPKIIQGAFHEAHNDIEPFRSRYLDYLKESIYA